MSKIDSTLDLLRLAWINLAGSGGGRKGDLRTQRIAMSTHQGGSLTIRLTFEGGCRGILLDAPCADGLLSHATESIQLVPQPVEIDGQSEVMLHARCGQSRLNEVFALVATSIVGRLQGGHSVESSVIDAIGEFRELLRTVRARGLTLEEELGLFGELRVLERLSVENPHAVGCWCGPLGEPKDFRGPNGSVEVKTTRDREFSEVSISSLDQLATEDSGSHHLVAIAVELNDVSGRSIGEIVDSLIGCGVSGELLWPLLIAAGYDASAGSNSALRRFHVLEERTYRVDDGFPRLVRNSFGSAGLPLGVRSVRYAIDLSHAEQFRVNKLAERVLFEQFAGGMSE